MSRGEIPLILRREIYATASFVGALFYIFLLRIRLTGLVGIILPVIVFNNKNRISTLENFTPYFQKSEVIITMHILKKYANSVFFHK